MEKAARRQLQTTKIVDQLPSPTASASPRDGLRHLFNFSDSSKVLSCPYEITDTSTDLIK